MGSSPRVRGKLRQLRHRLGDRGLIPACAGKTLSANATVPLSKGSSPRVRGKQGPTWKTVQTRGLIPACAGKTERLGSYFDLNRAHPRVCGENLLATRLARVILGSSPRVRGKLRSFPACRCAGRLIPACAGKTSLGPQSESRQPAHPRVCGENARVSPRRSQIRGSSPRVRGKPNWESCGFMRSRLIPACAGKT